MRLLARAVPLVLFAAGCGSTPTAPDVHAPTKYDPDAMTAALLAEYDRNGNGTLEGAELDACPALKGALAGIDTNRDGKLSAAELKARFESYGSVATVAFTATFTLDGAPLTDANVQFVPEACMGGVVQEATGTTGADGSISSFTFGGKSFAGLQPGLYKVKVTRTSGKELLPRYNTQTTLGTEVSSGRGGRTVSFALTSR